MSKVLFLVNHDVVIYNFRLELVERLLSENYEVVISSPYGERIDDLIKLGCKYYEIKLTRRGINPIKELKLIREYKKLIQSVNPDVVLTYTIKPNIYGSMACRSKKVPCLANITGLGTAIKGNSILQIISTMLYKYSFRNIKKVFFQNEENMQFFIDNRIAVKQHCLLPGSGVNLDRFTLTKYPEENEVHFAYISRVMKEKGIEEFLYAARAIKEKYPQVFFHVCGFCEEAYETVLVEEQGKGIIKYHGMVRNIGDVLKNMHCVVLPSYHEGMSNVLLEAAATGRPLIASDIPGCRETMIDGESGYLIAVRNKEDLINKMVQFIELPFEKKREMGIKARRHVEEHFDRQIVVEAYMNEIKSLEDK